MSIRKYIPSDYEAIEDMLITEGIPHYQQCFTLNGYYTYALEEIIINEGALCSIK